MKRIALHWTGGNYEASEYERDHYHALVEGDGTRVDGHKAPEANRAPLGPDYVRHAGGFNSDAIGMAICAMGGKGVSESPLRLGRYAPTEMQVKELCKWAAEMCHVYGIAVTPDTVLTHAEVRQRFGRGVYKWDITVFPWLTPMKLTPNVAGDYLRGMIQSELDKLTPQSVATESEKHEGSILATFVRALLSIFGKGRK